MTLACFDLDGCLVDSSRAIPTAVNHGLAAVGLDPLPIAELRWMIGPPLAVGVGELLRRRGADPALVDGIVAGYRAHYAEAAADLTTVVDGIPAALAELASSHRLVVVTSKPQAFAEPLVEALGLRGWFEAIHGPAVDVESEDKRVTLGRALAAARTRPRDAVMIGDRHHDVVAGVAHGTRTVGVTWGSGDEAELRAAGADAVVDRPADLVAAVRGRPTG